MWILQNIIGLKPTELKIFQPVLAKITHKKYFLDNIISSSRLENRSLYMKFRFLGNLVWFQLLIIKVCNNKDVWQKHISSVVKLWHKQSCHELNEQSSPFISIRIQILKMNPSLIFPPRSRKPHLNHLLLLNPLSWGWLFALLPLPSTPLMMMRMLRGKRRGQRTERRREQESTVRPRRRNMSNLKMRRQQLLGRLLLRSLDLIQQKMWRILS